MKVSPTKEVPRGKQDVLSGKPQRLWDYFKKLIRYLTESYEDLANAINYNADHHKPRTVAQDNKPTPEKNEILLWQDTDASSGNPTHYIVWNHDGTVLTFASEETAA
jgi:hypothetical protein